MKPPPAPRPARSSSRAAGPGYVRTDRDDADRLAALVRAACFWNLLVGGGVFFVAGLVLLVRLHDGSPRSLDAVIRLAIGIGAQLGGLAQAATALGMELRLLRALRPGLVPRLALVVLALCALALALLAAAWYLAADAAGANGGLLGVAGLTIVACAVAAAGAAVRAAWRLCLLPSAP